MNDKPDKVEKIFDALRKGEHQLATNGNITKEILEEISKPLFSEEEHWARR